MKFNLREQTPVRHPRIKVVGDRKVYHATAAEMADPEWRARFAIDFPGTDLIENRPIMIGKPNA